MNTFWRWTVVMFTQQCSPEFTVYLPWHLRFAQQRAGEWVGGCFNYSARSWGELSSHCSGLEKVQALHAHVQGSFQSILGGGDFKVPRIPRAPVFLNIQVQIIYTLVVLSFTNIPISLQYWSILCRC